MCTRLYYNIDVIERRFWLAAMHAPYLDGAREKPRKKPRENVSKKQILKKIIIKLSKKASYYLDGDGKIDSWERITEFNICVGLWRGRSVSAFSKQAKQQIYLTNETFCLFLQIWNAHNFRKGKKQLGKKKNNKLVCDNISKKVDDMEYLYLVNTSCSVSKL